jgi:hypothetical protein
MKKPDATHPGLIAVKQEMNKAAVPAINIVGATTPTPTETDKTHKQSDTFYIFTLKDSRSSYNCHKTVLHFE